MLSKLKMMFCSGAPRARRHSLGALMFATLMMALMAGMAPHAEAQTITRFDAQRGPVGAFVTGTGTNFTGATSVSFNGTAATTYTVNSATQITATVPTGATTGKISVTTPNGTATSAADFSVPETPSLIVTTTSDASTNTDGLTSLREAITYANSKAGDDTITFAAAVTGTINLGCNFHIVKIGKSGFALCNSGA